MQEIGWGLVGGGEGSQIGPVHRAAAALDGRFRLRAAALDADPERARTLALALGMAPDRAYGDWRAMLRGEAARDDPVTLVTVATPNATHFGIAKSFLEAGFHVLCEKPMTLTVPEARDLLAVAQRTGRICAVNFGYSGYPMVRQMRAMVAAGTPGRIRVVKAEFAGGFMAADPDHPRTGWRLDPAQAGVSGITMDAGIHALHMACFVTGQRIESVASDFVPGAAGGRLEDDSWTAFRMSGDIAGRAWASGLAIGRAHGLSLEVFGTAGGLGWTQEQPNQLYWTPLNRPTRRLERGTPGLSAAAQRASRTTAGHPEGMVTAFANIYLDLADLIASQARGEAPDPLATACPDAGAGLHTVAVIHAIVHSARQSGAWVDVV